MPFQFLGTSGAIPSVERDNTSLLFYSEDEAVLVDCPGSPYQKLLLAGIDPTKLSSLIITHRHEDHVYGLPSLAHNLGLAGRRSALQVYALPETMRVIRGFQQVFPDHKLPYPLELHDVPSEAGRPLLQAQGFRIGSTPVKHGVPNIALRVDFERGSERGSVVYSSDTNPCSSLIALARGADVLIHEATMPHTEAARAAKDGHTTARQAGEVASEAGVRCLMLCHFEAGFHSRLGDLRREAAEQFHGPVEIPEEFHEYTVGQA